MLQRSTPPRKTVVVVGASFGGLTALRELMPHTNELFDIVLIDFKDYFEYTPGILRCFTDPSYLQNVTSPLESWASKRVRFVHGEVLFVKDGELAVRPHGAQASELLAYDYLVMACGSSYPQCQPVKAIANEPTLVERQATFVKANAQLQQAQRVLILGAGLVGVELAGEILTDMPGKDVVIVDAAKTVCPGVQPGAQAYCRKWLDDKGAEVLLDQWIESIDERGCSLRGGRRIDADIVYSCMGFKSNAKHILSLLGADCVDKRGFAIVNDHLQLKGCDRVFVVGDCMVHTASSETKLGHTAELNAQLAAKNIVSLAQQSGGSLLTYPIDVVGVEESPKICCISLGRYDGTLCFNNLVVHWVPAVLMKYLLESTKVSEFSANVLSGAFWDIANPISNAISKFAPTAIGGRSTSKL